VIGALNGSIAAVEQADASATALIDVAGVGYEVVISTRLARELGGVGESVRLSVHTHVREGAITLYGFSSREERHLFELLIGAHGIGPALALGILSVHSSTSLVAAVATADVDALCLVPGVGKKTAQRLLVELAGRVGADGTGGTPVANGDAPLGTHAEVREALGALGYAPDEIRAALERVGSDGSVEELLREALFELAPRR
jgi:holliday junction DNA helicase RuvA